MIMNQFLFILQLITGVALACLVILFTLIWLAFPAAAHSWYSKKQDPVYRHGCCGGVDCAQFVITRENLIAEAEGYRIVLTHEEAKRINAYTTSGINALVTYDRVQPSEDGNWHLCIMSYSRNSVLQGVYCLFAPPNI